MSSSRPQIRTSLALALALVVLPLAGCQVRPLYADGDGTRHAIAIAEAENRVEQRVRNELIFAFNDGAGAPVDPQYRLELDATSQLQGVLRAGSSDEFTAARVVVTVQYQLFALAEDTALISGSRKASAEFDNPDQEFGERRALRDAEDRASREAAAFIKAEISGKLAALGR
ncbi:LPS assembly lipoprotein LptE [Pseudohoeflea coraliihabitans]|uniref:LPS-assembly lipoprotein n=1 Tax=Pseudohoeflea coraliihabitans TaxID=2860393 RepID=A0ABS6WUN6_9HYPH|nr:LPS assembly lipoprotein LptE [Pseudohoeflea sp. DP4N28-3]MBW3099147.1 hypothetical protein [Pseudohoeflea sp. DP4N28-3]